MDRLLGMLIAGLIGWLIVETVVTVVMVIKECITSRNLGKYCKEALASNEETRDLITNALQFELTKLNGNALSIDTLRNGKKVAKIELRTEEFVASDVREGMKIAA